MSYERKPFEGEQEWEINIEGDTVEAGTNVYYARMMKEGHATGWKRICYRKTLFSQGL